MASLPALLIMDKPIDMGIPSKFRTLADPVIVEQHVEQIPAVSSSDSMEFNWAHVRTDAIIISS